MGILGRAPAPGFVLRPVLRAYARAFRADLAEMERPLEDYRTFLDFFTRTLKPGARSWPDDPRAVASPADGRIHVAGEVRAGTALQAKGIPYAVSDLLGSAEDAAAFEGGTFSVVYLAPGDYHRFHWPFDATVDTVRHLPGDLWPVNDRALAGVPGLFARNERVAVLGRTPDGGAFAVVPVGALDVGSIRLAFHPVRTNGVGRARPRTWSLAGIGGKRGAELGRFEFGSSIVLLLSAAAGALDPLVRGTRVRLGDPIGRLAGKAPRRPAPRSSPTRG
jgi:phosphatidylserine decarboxylase